jgi:hypothetical protein
LGVDIEEAFCEEVALRESLLIHSLPVLPKLFQRMAMGQ